MSGEVSDRVPMYFRNVDARLAQKLREFAVKKFGSDRYLSEALNYILKEFFEQYEAKDPFIKTPRTIKRFLRVIEFIYVQCFADQSNETAWIPWELIEKFIIEELGIRSRPSLLSYYNSLKHIARNHREYRNGKKKYKLLEFTRSRIVQILKSYGVELPDAKKKEKQRIKITKTETKTFEIETEGNVSLKDVIAYALELREQGYSLDEIEDKVKDLGFDIPKRNLRGMMRRDMRDYDPFV